MKKTLIVAVALGAALLTAGCAGEGEKAAATKTTTAVTTAAPTTTATQGTFPFTGYVNATTLNVRPTPDTSGYSIGGLKFGEAVTVVGREGDWYQIQFGTGTGYVSAQYVQESTPGEVNNGTASATTTGNDSEIPDPPTKANGATTATPATTAAAPAATTTTKATTTQAPPASYTGEPIATAVSI